MVSCLAELHLWTLRNHINVIGKLTSFFKENMKTKEVMLFVINFYKEVRKSRD